MSTSFRRQLLASTLLIGGLSVGSAAFAQATQPAEASPDVAAAETAQVQEVVVTGSRIARPNLEQSSPVNVVSEQEISLQQPVNAEEFLRDLPGTVPGVGAQVNNGANGSATINLRNLGVNRNLVLLNGRRVVPAQLNAVVDTNVIPVALIQRVDVFTGGASSVYGADAVAGVVNFVTRRDFAGVNLSANYGLTERGDGRNYRADLIIGANFDDGRGNVVLGIGHTKTLPIYQGERSIATVSRASTLRAFPGGDPRYPGRPQGSTTANPASIFFPLNGRFDPASGTIITGGPESLSNYNFNPLNVFQTPLERFGIFTQGRYEISPAVEIFSEAFFNRSQVRQIIAPTGSFVNTIQVPLNNPFLTPAQALQLCQAGIPGDFNPNVDGRQGPGAALCGSRASGTGFIGTGTEIDAVIARRFTEAGPRLTTYRTNSFQVTAGARGPLTATLDWEISGQYGESDRRNTNTQQGLAERLQQGLRSCVQAPGGARIAAGCVPINIFGGEGSFTPEMFRFIDVATNSFIETELGAAQLNVSGDIGIASPFASEPIGVAIGGEYRRYAGAQRGDLATTTPGAVLGAGGAFTSIAGEYDSKEVYGELIVPIVEDRPFIYNLTAEGGVRYSDYSTSGGNWTYKAGGSYSPVRDVKFRGVYSRAVRAPNLGELFAPTSTGLTNRAIDPCEGSLAEVGARGPAYAALCNAQLAAVGSRTGLGGISPPPAGQINQTSGGNPDLDPEKATTFTAGVVLQPSFLPGFSATFDWVRIKITNAISSPSQSDVIDGCFAQTDPNFDLCRDIFRNPLTGGLGGDPATTRGPLVLDSNLGRYLNEGFDFGANYTRDFGLFRGLIAFNGNRTTKSRFQATPRSINRECVQFYSSACDPVLPKWVWNVRTTASFASTDVSVLWRHIGRTKVEPVELAAADRPPLDVAQNAGPQNVLSEYQTTFAADYFDLSLQQSVNDALTFTFLVENLFDRDPPDVGNTVGSTSYNSGNTFPSTYDALGRRFRIGANLRF